MTITATRGKQLTQVVLDDQGDLVFGYNYASVDVQEAGADSFELGQIVIWDDAGGYFEKVDADADFTTEVVTSRSTLPNGEEYAIIVGDASGFGNTRDMSVEAATSKSFTVLYRGIASVLDSGLVTFSGISTPASTAAHKILEKRGIAVQAQAAGLTIQKYTEV